MVMKTTLNYLVLACLVTGIIMLNGCKKEPDPVSLPTVVTSSVSEITLNTAIVKGMVIAEGGAVVTARGICWNTAPKPTINDSRTTDGAGFGAFTSNITSLSPNTTYHVRAYAINSEGIRYGDDLTFHTKQGPPILLATIITMDISSVTSTSAFSGGNITDNGGDQFTVSGVCWSTVQNPSVNDSETFAQYRFSCFYQYYIQLNTKYNLLCSCLCN